MSEENRYDPFGTSSEENKDNPVTETTDTPPVTEIPQQQPEEIRVNEPAVRPETPSYSSYEAPRREYGYDPRYTPQNNNLYGVPNGYNSPYSYQSHGYNPDFDRPETPKKKKKKGNGGLVAACIILSLLCGFAGAFGGMYLYNEQFAKEAAGNNATSNPTGGTSVFYESIDRELPESVTRAGTVAAVAEIALPSVVEIRTEAVVNNSFYGQYVTEGAGSGVIISTDGYIVTNNHVISGASNITVRLTTGEEHNAKLIGTDAQTDIAVIKIEKNDLIPAVFGDSSKLVIGELTVAIGNPLGELGGTVTDGIISALDREITVEGENMVLLQTNAAVSPGNSGGGLFNANGELIGVVNAKSSGSSVEGLGFAIPVNTAKTIIKDLIEKGHVTGRPSIGITIIEVTTDYQRYMYNVPAYGVYIQKAINQEFKSGDRIIAIDGNSISTSSDIKSVINNHQVGDKVTVTVARNNKIVDVEVTLIDSAENTLTTEN